MAKKKVAQATKKGTGTRAKRAAKGKDKSKNKKSVKTINKTKQKLELKATVTDGKGHTEEFTKPFGEDIIIMENMTNVGFSYGETINTGNYSSVKFQVSLHVPCLTEEMNKYFPAAQKKVMKWAKEIKKEIV